MTVKQAFKKLQWETEEKIYRPMYDIDFVNEEGEGDEVQFTTSASDSENELCELFEEFCKENGCRKNSVISITLVGNDDEFLRRWRERHENI